MSLLPFLSLHDEQIEVVIEAVHRWCEENNHHIDDERGRAALSAAIAIALTDRWNTSQFPSQLRKQLNDQGEV